MKLVKNLIPVLLMLFIAIPGFSNETTPAVRNTTPTEAAARVEVLTSRLNEIKAMDIESMERKEKRALRKEVKAIEKEMKKINEGGVFISVGGIIIILLLLILLL
jgi:hypothetical protein